MRNFPRPSTTWESDLDVHAGAERAMHDVNYGYVADEERNGEGLPFWIRNRRKATINREPSRRSPFAIRYSLRERHDAGECAPAEPAPLFIRR
jgi:hypothetical protein